MEDMWKDWFIRYSSIYKCRYTKKEKMRFLKAFVVDIAQIRKDIKVIEYQHGITNVYVGDVEHADKIICTYYDTPPISIKNYPLFDTKLQKKQILSAIIPMTTLWIFFFFIFTFILYHNLINKFSLVSIQTLGTIIFYFLYFKILSSISKGAINRKTLIRNTSSLLCILDILNKYRLNKKIAFAFVDGGCSGGQGLDILCSVTRKNAKIYYLDCIGADATLYGLGNFKKLDDNERIQLLSSTQRVQYLFCADQKDDDGFKLDQKILKQKHMNYENYLVVKEILEKELMLC